MTHSVRSGKTPRMERPPRLDDPPGGDEHHLVIEGRRWRKSDPSIPATLRAELVHALMGARREVGAAKRAGDAAAERAARNRVNDAKVALGERGPAWWEPQTDAALRPRIAAVIRALLRHRGADKTICPSDVARVVGAAGWRARMPAVRSVAIALAQAGELEVRQRGRAVSPAEARGPVRFAPRAGPTTTKPAPRKR